VTSAAAGPPLAEVLDGIRCLIGVQDADGRYLFVNNALAEFHGLPRELFIGRTPRQLNLMLGCTPRDAGLELSVTHGVELTDATGRHRRFDVVHRQLDGCQSSSPYVLQVATETWTEPTAPEDRLAIAEQRLDLALANGNLGLVDWDLATDRLVPNAQLRRQLDADERSPLTGTWLAAFIDPRDKARVALDLEAHLDGRTPDFHCQYRLRIARGRVRWVLASGSVVERAANGRPLRYLGTLQDVTESVEIEEELDRQLMRSREATLVTNELAGEVRQLEAEIREISEREQERIGHDLHDGLGQELTGVSLLLKTLEDAIERDAPQLRSRVRSVRELVEQSIATTRSLAHGLSPVHLDRDGVVGALEHLAADSESLYGIPVQFVCSRREGLQGLSAASDLYRIAQEAIRNAARHSGAESIELRLDIEHDRLVVAVEDDGHGMPSDVELRGGMGLKIMRYRASIIGASLAIEPKDGGGTVVRCTLLRQLREGD
jgi:signal transduction histidine kinase